MNELLQSFIAGGLSGCMVDLILFPLDSIKTRIQMKKSLVLSFHELYKGIYWPLASSFPCAAVFWTGFTMMKTFLNSVYPDSYLTDFFSALFGSFCSSLVRCPFELLKTLTISGKCENFFDAPVKIIGKEGISGLYVGLEALLYRELPFDSMQMIFYAFFSSFWVFNQRLGPFSVSGALAGACTGFLTTPIDVVKTKIMADHRKSQSFYKSAAIIYNSEGISGLWRGWKPRVMFITVGGWIFFGSFELFKAYL
jgi:solute carrier family 25 S-adenosylmethionine transporter 26